MNYASDERHCHGLSWAVTSSAECAAVIRTCVQTIQGHKFSLQCS